MNKPSPLIPIGLGLLSVLLAVKITWPQLNQAITDRQVLQQDIEALKTDAAALSAEKARAENLKKSYEALQATLPSQEELPQVIGTLNETARVLGLQSHQISRSTHPSTLPGVNALDLDLDITGSYPRIQAYVGTLANLKRAYTTRGITISAAADGTVTSSLKLTTYWRDEQAALNPTPEVTPLTTIPTTGGQP